MRERIGVIGAGVAGLACARALADQGLDVTVLEARQRVGGRLWTVRPWAQPMELGVSFVNGSAGNPVAELVAQAGARTSVYHPLLTRILTAEGRALSDEVLFGVMSRLVQLRAEADTVARSLPEGTSIGQWMRSSSLPGMTGEERGVLRWLLESYALFEGAGLDELPLRYISHGERFEGDAWVLPDGFDVLATHLARGLEVRLGCAVQRVDHSGKRVKLHTPQGILEVDRVIVTVPLGNLQAGSVEFVPELPAAKLGAIHRLGVGLLNKVLLRFDDAFWPADREFFGLLRDGPNPFPEVMSWSSHGRLPVLLAFTGGAPARALEGETDAGVVAAAMETLRRMFGSAVPEPEAALISRWGREPWSLGSYSHLPLGASPEDHDTLAEPVDGRILFAGEATDRDHAGGVAGALLSARREVRRLRGSV